MDQKNVLAVFFFFFFFLWYIHWKMSSIDGAVFGGDQCHHCIARHHHHRCCMHRYIWKCKLLTRHWVILSACRLASVDVCLSLWYLWIYLSVSVSALIYASVCLWCVLFNVCQFEETFMCASIFLVGIEVLRSAGVNQLVVSLMVFAGACLVIIIISIIIIIIIIHWSCWFALLLGLCLFSSAITSSPIKYPEFYLSLCTAVIIVIVTSSLLSLSRHHHNQSCRHSDCRIWKAYCSSTGCVQDSSYKRHSEQFL